MKKSELFILIAISVVVFLGIFVASYYSQSTSGAANYRDIVFTIDGNKTLLTDAGIQYFGNEAVGDFNSDGDADAVFLFTHDGDGSGTFYYAVAALGSIKGFKGTNAVLLGDRIAPQTTEFRDGKIIVNYADRKPTEPFSAKPSVGISKYFTIYNGVLTPTTQ